MNKHNYREAMRGLEDKFGNIHTIMRLLLHDIRSLLQRNERKCFKCIHGIEDECHFKIN